MPVSLMIGEEILLITTAVSQWKDKRIKIKNKDKRKKRKKRKKNRDFHFIQSELNIKDLKDFTMVISPPNV